MPLAIPAARISELCQELELDSAKCRTLSDVFEEYCKVRRGGGKEGNGRGRTKWQECIATRRKGQKFDPDAIRALAKEYKEGKCP